MRKQFTPEELNNLFDAFPWHFSRDEQTAGEGFSDFSEAFNRCIDCWDEGIPVAIFNNSDPWMRSEFVINPASWGDLHEAIFWVQHDKDRQ